MEDGNRTVDKLPQSVRAGPAIDGRRKGLGGIVISDIPVRLPRVAFDVSDETVLFKRDDAERLLHRYLELQPDGADRYELGRNSALLKLAFIFLEDGHRRAKYFRDPGSA